MPRRCQRPIAQLQLPVPWLGSVNVWLLEGEPLTLVDTGPSNGRAAEALDDELARHGHAVKDIELVLVTHHHLDHSGMAGAIRARAGAKDEAGWSCGFSPPRNGVLAS